MLVGNAPYVAVISNKKLLTQMRIAQPFHHDGCLLILLVEIVQLVYNHKKGRHTQVLDVARAQKGNS